MIGRRMANLEQITYASPAYLMQLGVPANLKALARHRQLSVRVRLFADWLQALFASSNP